MSNLELFLMLLIYIVPVAISLYVHVEFIRHKTNLNIAKRVFYFIIGLTPIFNLLLYVILIILITEKIEARRSSKYTEYMSASKGIK